MTPSRTGISYATDLPFAFDLIHQAAWARNLRVVSYNRWLYDIRDDHGTSVSFVRAMPGSTPVFAQQCLADKSIAKAHLHAAGVRIAQGRRFGALQKPAAFAYAQSLNAPCVIKPASGQGGKGVTTNITSRAGFDLAWHKACSESPFGTRAGLLVERFVPGGDHRLLMAGGRIIAALRKWPLYVVGDGQSTMDQLMARKRASRQNNVFTRRQSFEISQTVQQDMLARGLTPDHVPARGQYLELDTVGNLAAGGESETIPLNTIDPGFAVIAKQAATALPGVIFCGLDLLARDITQPPETQPWALCEVNLNPDIGLHHFPVKGDPVDAAGAYLAHFFPNADQTPPWDQMQNAVIPLHSSLEPWQFSQLRQLAQIRSLQGGIARQDWQHAQIVVTGPPQAVQDICTRLGTPEMLPGIKVGRPQRPSAHPVPVITRPFQSA